MIANTETSYQYSSQYKPLKLEIKESYKKESLNWDLAYTVYENETIELNFKRTTSKTKLEKCSLFSSRDIEGFKEGGKLSYISFQKKSGLACHLLDCNQKVNGRVPMALHAKYDHEADALVIYFVDNDLYKQGNFKTNLQSSYEPYEYDVFLDLDKEDNIMAIEFASASSIFF